MRWLVPLTVIAVLGLVAPAGAVELGREGKDVAPSCPKRCQALGMVSGYQLRLGDRVNPFRVDRDGRVTAFTLTLGRPSSSQARFFSSTFGGPPRARLSILRRGTLRKHRLVAQSAVFDMTPHLGTTRTFRLSPPLAVKEGNVVALTVPTWAPAFAVGLSDREGWRSSRNQRRCADIRQRAAQQRVGGLRTYGCFYKTARITYTATFQPSAGSRSDDEGEDESDSTPADARSEVAAEGR